MNQDELDKLDELDDPNQLDDLFMNIQDEHSRGTFKRNFLDEHSR